MPPVWLSARDPGAASRSAAGMRSSLVKISALNPSLELASQSFLEAQEVEVMWGSRRASLHQQAGAAAAPVFVAGA